MFYITLSSTNLDQILQRRQNETFYKKRFEYGESVNKNTFLLSRFVKKRRKSRYFTRPTFSYIYLRWN